MAEAPGVASNIITIIHITEEIIALAEENMSTDHAKIVLSRFLGRLTASQGRLERLQFQAESHEADAIRLSPLNYVGGPLEVYKTSLSFIKDTLQKPMKKTWLGRIVEDTTQALGKLGELRPLLELALEADQRYAY
jgi:hypothetical protein